MPVCPTVHHPDSATNISFTDLMFSIPVGICINSHKKTITANSVCISLFGDFELQVSACYSHHQAPLQEPDDGHNRPKLVAQNFQIKRYKQSWLTDFFVRISFTDTHCK
jgi:hypothetical protein